MLICLGTLLANTFYNCNFPIHIFGILIPRCYCYVFSMLLLSIFPYIQMMNKGKQEDGRGVNWSGQIWQTRLHMAFLIANIQVFLIVSCGPA